VLLEVTFDCDEPDLEKWGEYVVPEGTFPPGEREWCVPTEVVNQQATVRRLSDEEAEHVRMCHSGETLPISVEQDRIFKEHEQISRWSSLPSAIELILKLNGAMESGRYDLQEHHRENKELTPWSFDGEAHGGFTFTVKDFGCDEAALRLAINSELDAGRFVIVIVREGSDCRAWVAFSNERGRLLAVSSRPDPVNLEEIRNISWPIKDQQVTSILIYR